MRRDDGFTRDCVLVSRLVGWLVGGRVCVCASSFCLFGCCNF